jgi:hypothetical protein
MATSETSVRDDDIWVTLVPEVGPPARKSSSAEPRRKFWNFNRAPAAQAEAEKIVDAFRCAGQI